MISWKNNKKLIFVLVVVSIVLLFVLAAFSRSGSSYQDCKKDCKWGFHHDEICTDNDDWFDGCTDQEMRRLNKVCFEECKGVTIVFGDLAKS